MVIGVVLSGRDSWSAVVDGALRRSPIPAVLRWGRALDEVSQSLESNKLRGASCRTWL